MELENKIIEMRAGLSTLEVIAEALKGKESDAILFVSEQLEKLIDEIEEVFEAIEQENNQ